MTLAPLEIVGHQNDQWAKQQKFDTKRNSVAERGDLTVQDMVDNVLRKPAFGFEGYTIKPTHKDMVPIRGHKAGKMKRRTFVEEIPLKKQFIPASNKYQTAADWTKNPVSQTARFFQMKRYTQADEIFVKAKKPEKTTPGPFAY